MKSPRRMPWYRALAAAALTIASGSAAADLSVRYAVDVHRPDKVFAGTTIFGDESDPKNPLIVEVDMTGRVVWSFDVPSEFGDGRGMDVEWVPGKDTILFTRESGVYEVDRRTKKIVWSHKAPSSHDADRLPNGNTLVAWGWGSDSSDPEVREVDSSGTVVWKWHAEQHLGDEKRLFDQEGFTHTNSVVRLANGNTLISLRNFYMLVEVDPAGRVVWKLPGLFTTPHDPEILPNGNILVNTRGPQVINEITPAGKVVWRYRPDQDDVQTVRYNHRLPNGNILFVERTKIIEITPTREIVWQLRLKDVGTGRADKRKWLYKAERIPPGHRPIAVHAFVAPSDTVARAGGGVTTLEDQVREEAQRRTSRMFAQMDSDGDGRITRSEFADRGQFDAIDGDGDGHISQTEAEGFQMQRILRQRGGERSGGRRGRDR